MRIAMTLATVLLLSGCMGARKTPDDFTDGSPLLLAFLPIDDPGDLLLFDFTDPGVFRFARMPGGDGVLQIVGTSGYTPPFRSPLALAILRDADVAECDMTFLVRQTGREYPHRDLCLVFGYQDPAHFYYAHLASAADDNAHQVMIVDGADRRPITSNRNSGVNWGATDEWHKVRMAWRKGRVKVFFDESVDPVLEAEDETFTHGRIGFGSFDDTGELGSMHGLFWERAQGLNPGGTASDDGSTESPN